MQDKIFKVKIFEVTHKSLKVFSLKILGYTVHMLPYVGNVKVIVGVLIGNYYCMVMIGEC